MSSNSEPPSDFVSLAEEYHEVLITGDEPGEKIDGAEKIETLEQEVERLEDDLKDYEEGHPLHSVLKEEHKEKKEQLESHQAETKRKDTLRTEFPQRLVSDFAATEDLLTEAVIQSITHSLTGAARDEILVGQVRLTPQTDLDRGAIIRATKNIHQVANYQTSGKNEVQNTWESLSDREKSIIRVLATANEELGPTGIAEELDEDVTKGAVGPVLSDDQDRECPLTFNGTDGYRLSLMGRYIWSKCGSEFESESDVTDAPDDGEDSEGDDSPEGQLDEFTD